MASIGINADTRRALRWLPPTRTKPITLTSLVSRKHANGKPPLSCPLATSSDCLAALVAGQLSGGQTKNPFQVAQVHLKWCAGEPG